MQCIGYNPEVEVTIMDLPQQLGLMREATRGKAGADRIKEYPANLLDPKGTFPKGFDVIWMSNSWIVSPKRRSSVSSGAPLKQWMHIPYYIYWRAIGTDSSMRQGLTALLRSAFISR